MKLLQRAWESFWFEMRDTKPLEIIRVGLGIVISIHYITLLGNLSILFGTNGLISVETARNATSTFLPVALYWFQSDLFLYAFTAVTIVSAILFSLGIWTNVTKYFVFYGHYCFLKRSPYLVGGADRVTLSLLLILCIAPLGDLRLRFPSIASAALRLIQIQIGVIYFFAGTKKLEVPAWWSGDALWTALIDPQYSTFWAGFFSHHYWMLNIACYATLVFEIGYVFLVINPRFRPWVLIGALALHLGIFVFMGLFYFASAMIVANMAFLDEGLRNRLRKFVAKRIGADLSVKDLSVQPQHSQLV